MDSLRSSRLALLLCLCGACAGTPPTGINKNASQSSATSGASSGPAPQTTSPALSSLDAAANRRFTTQDFAQHTEQLRARLPSNRFTIVVERPFVVVGDESPAEVKRRAETVVRWTVSQLERHLFAQEPEAIIDVWLFRDRQSYEKNTLLLTGESPTTLYGFYSPSHNALFMNIDTGSGTLVHEMVHPYVRANFPGCPAWFNEGLGSLYEACGERNGTIWGATNWRLPDLQKAIRSHSAIPLERLLSLQDTVFYGDDRGLHYAQARYLCYYLQHKGLLFRYYREFRAGHATDPQGLETLKRVIGLPDLRAFQKDWEDFVLQLRFPNIEVSDAPPLIN